MRTLLLAGGLLLVSSPAFAHFELQAPAAYSEQDALGGPQKSVPCGQDDTGQPMVATNAVTTFMEGSMVTITIDEKVTHPGHYRVSLAQDITSLPADPTVTAGDTACGSIAIESPPVLPLIADDLFDHTMAFTAPQTTTVQLPAGMTCTNCVLQVTEFMSDHGLNPQGGCFYHHCAMVNIVANAPPVDAGAAGSGGDAGTTGSSKSGGCQAQGGVTGAGLLALIVGSLIGWRRRRASSAS